MGFFNFLKKEEFNYTDFHKVLVDNMYLIDIPSDWLQFKSDRFRAKSKNNTIEFSVTNYLKNSSDAQRFGSDDLKNQFLPLFKKFVNEGGYVSNEDLEIEENYIYQSFKVGKETQYYYYTSVDYKEQIIVIAMILRQKGKLHPKHVSLIKKIGKSIAVKII